MPLTPNNDFKTWTVTVEQDPQSGDLVLPFPTDLLAQMGWIEGTELWWNTDDQGKIYLTNKPNEVSIVTTT